MEEITNSNWHSFVLIPEEDPVADFEIINYQQNESEDEDANLFFGFRPVWIPDNERINCKLCNVAFSFVKRSNKTQFIMF